MQSPCQLFDWSLHTHHPKPSTLTPELILNELACYSTGLYMHTTINHKPQTPNPKPQTLNPKPQTLNPCNATATHRHQIGIGVRRLHMYYMGRSKFFPLGVLHCVVVCCSVLQCDTVRCSVLQCVAVCCSVFRSYDRVNILKNQLYSHCML